jgi:hypothetical protein
VKRDRTIFYASVGWYEFGKKHTGTYYVEHVFLHLVRSTGYVVHSGASEVQVLTLFFMLGWDQYGFNKKRTGTHYAELVFFASGGICGSCRAFRCIQ